METNLEVLNKLEDLLVSEFRTWQALKQLARDEQAALLQQNLRRLRELVGRKAVLLEALSDLEQARRAQMSAAGILVHQPAAGSLTVQLKTLTAPPGSLPFPSSALDRLSRLFLGLLALLDYLRELTLTNRSIADALLWREKLLPGDPRLLPGYELLGGNGNEAV